MPVEVGVGPPSYDARACVVDKGGEEENCSDEMYCIYLQVRLENV